MAFRGTAGFDEAGGTAERWLEAEIEAGRFGVKRYVTMMSYMVRARATVRGRVQGVWYRGSARAEAARLGVTGWVRNEPDGSVALEAQGARAAVEALLAWCRQGPPGARVIAVETEWLELEDGERRFEIRH